MSEPIPVREALTRAAVILGPSLVLVIALGFVPNVALDGALARGAVVAADLGGTGVVPWIALMLVGIVVTRPGLDWPARTRETVVLLGLLLLALGLMAFANENWIKPAMAIPRPNIVELADGGALGVSPDEFYSLGDKSERSAYLADRLGHPSAPPLADEVRQHWVTETGYSFPSGHSLAAMTFVAFFLTVGLSYLPHRRRSLVFSLLPIWALAVIASRPLLRVHSGLDIAVGAVEGVAIGLGAALVARWLLERQPAGATKDSVR